MKKTRLLFICTANLQRSPTAADLFYGSNRYEAKSAGISEGAPVPASQQLIDWADMIFVMNERDERHASFLLDRFNLRGKPIHNLDIADQYLRDDPKLAHLIRTRMQPFIDVKPDS